MQGKGLDVQHQAKPTYNSNDSNNNDNNNPTAIVDTLSSLRRCLCSNGMRAIGVLSPPGAGIALGCQGTRV